jgi:hypothetical protein
VHTSSVLILGHPLKPVSPGALLCYGQHPAKRGRSSVSAHSSQVLPRFKVYRNWDKERQYKARGLVPSTIFLVGIVIASICTMLSDRGLQEVRVVGGTDASLTVIATAAGYFLYDSAVIAYHIKVITQPGATHDTGNLARQRMGQIGST